MERPDEANPGAVPAHEQAAVSHALERSQQVREKVEEVSETLLQGVASLMQTEIALANSRLAQAQAEAALAIAEVATMKAELRALHDATTGLPNRNLFNDRLEHAISIAERHGWALAVMFLDIDQFKTVNDTHGHAAGDTVLKEIAARLARHSREEDTICRNGGDEFLLLFMNPQGSDAIAKIAAGVLESIAHPIDVGGAQVVIKTSVGIAVYPGNGTIGEQLVANADSAMYRAKRSLGGYAFC